MKQQYSNVTIQGDDNFIKRNLVINVTQFSKASNQKLVTITVDVNQVVVAISGVEQQISTVGCFGKFSQISCGDIVADLTTAVINNRITQTSDNLEYSILGIDSKAWDLNRTYQLIYVDDIVQAVQAIIDGIKHNMEYYNITGTELLNKLQSFHAGRTKLGIPQQNGLDKYLYATYLSFLPLNKLKYPLEAKSDQRGSFYEILRTDSYGQVAISTTNPTFLRGNHWHNTKIEKFLVLKGQADVLLREVDGESVVKITVSHQVPEIVEVPPGYVHSIINTGNDELLLLIWGSELFDATNPDTYYADVADNTSA